ncbi:hypothetical protein Nepgr_033800 [Nepenthes gracilis]|uniref:Uncharacterized protein n=1 Tax=Nepenthes gracilis TaxID=150966 RepID=A0AAD3TML5_NEPGR|nr:hypothetical protein Nepgr_033800 [Nepenthes gracilis]
MVSEQKGTPAKKGPKIQHRQERTSSKCSKKEPGRQDRTKEGNMQHTAFPLPALGAPTNRYIKTNFAKILEAPLEFHQREQMCSCITPTPNTSFDSTRKGTPQGCRPKHYHQQDAIFLEPKYIVATKAPPTEMVATSGQKVHHRGIPD